MPQLYASQSLAARVPRRAIGFEPALQSLKGLLFDIARSQPSIVSVPTLVNPDGPQRFPCVEAVLGTTSPVHDCTVSVLDDCNKEQQFLVSCQGGSNLPVNRSLRAHCPSLPWGGSVLVLKMGSRAPFVNLGTPDKDLALRAVLKFIQLSGDARVESELPVYVDL